MTENKNTETLFSIRDLVVEYHSGDSIIHAVNGVSLSLNAGETLGLVGETGAGKTTIARASLRILPDHSVERVEGEILFEGRDVLQMGDTELRELRGKKISMIFQDPMTALNPSLTVGEQVSEVIRLHQKLSRQEAMTRACEMLEMVGITAERYYDYPHQFSGGMKQRVVIATALACNPRLLIADEPTTALDVTIQAQVLDMIRSLQARMHTAMILITHDLGVVAEVCSKVAVIYAGQIVEYGSLNQIFFRARHPYTLGLFGSLPSLTESVRRLRSIKGLVPNPADLPPYCSFYDRCDHCGGRCKEGEPGLTEVEPGHFVRCRQFEEGGVGT